MIQAARGITLIEMLICLTIIAILSAIAYPSYQNHVIKTRQNEAKSALIENAHFMERWYAEKGSYKNSSTSWPSLPNSGTDFFDVQFSTSAVNTDEGEYLLRASPKTGQNWLGGTFLEMDASGNIKYCSMSGSTKKCSLTP